MLEMEGDQYRLPRTAVPERYELTLRPDLERAAFTGEETVQLTLTEASDDLRFNVLELEIDEALVVDGGERLPASVTLDSERQQARLHLPRPLSPGRYDLFLRFHGTLNDRLAGFYRSTYTTASGELRSLAVTQFEPTDARRAFPCWDEPAFKAVFSVTLVVDRGLTAISNGPVVSEQTAADATKKTVRFGDTPRMSTYLVAFAVGDFEASDVVQAAGVPLRVWSVPGNRHLSAYSLEAGAFALSFFAQYYDIPYPGAKLDLIAIPDFAAGAMENLGAVTFRESLLLIDRATATHSELESVAVVVSHELAHMWFGDLVTMRWWNGLWLNEAFATFMELLAVDAWKPEWQTWVGFGRQRAAALLIDGLKSTRAIEYSVRRPEDANAMFDVLTYQKGGSVLRMLEQYLGGERFRRGIQRYLRQHEYANTETTDLWDALEQATGEPVRRTMDSWIFQPGYPIVTVSPAEGGRLTVSQQRFLYLPEGDGTASEERWAVPLVLRVASNEGTTERRLLLTEETQELETPADMRWVVANAGGSGFYRVRYAPELLQSLTPEIQSELSAIERFNLVSDTWAATLAGYTSLNDFLALTERFREEKDEGVWSILLSSLGSIARMLGPAQRHSVARIVRDRLRAAYTRLGWESNEDEDDRTRQLRGEILSTLGTLGEDERVQAEARQRYERFRVEPEGVDPNVAAALIAILAASGDAARYDEFFRRFKDAPTPQQEERYLFALAGFRDHELLRRTLAHTLEGAIRSQNAPYVVRSVLVNIYGKELAWQFIKDNWDGLVARFPENTIPHMCDGVTTLNTPEQEEDVRRFFELHEVKQGKKQIEQHLERLHMAVLFRQRESDTLTTDGVNDG